MLQGLASCRLPPAPGLKIAYDLRLLRQRDGQRIIRSVRVRPAA